MYLILSFGYLIVADLKPVMASEKVKVNYGTEEALLAVVDKTKSHKIISWREQCGSLTEALFLQCPRLHEAKGLLHLFDFEPYQAKEVKQVQGEGTEQIQSVQGPDPVLPTTGGGPAGPIAGSAAESQARSSPQPAEPSPAEPSADDRLRDDSSLPSREPHVIITPTVSEVEEPGIYQVRQPYRSPTVSEVEEPGIYKVRQPYRSPTVSEVEEPGIYKVRQPYRSPTVPKGRDVPGCDTVEEPGIYQVRQPYRSPTESKGRDVPRPAPAADRGNVNTLLEVQGKDIGSLKVDMSGVKKELASLRTRMDNMDSMLAEVLKTVKSLEVSMLSHACSLSPVAEVPENLEGSESEADLRSGNQEAYNR